MHLSLRLAFARTDCTPMEKRENETLTVRDIKQILNISINAAYNLIHSKSFPVIRIGNSFRVPKEPFYEWMKSSHTIMN